MVLTRPIPPPKKAAPHGAAFFVLVDSLDSSLTTGSVLMERIAPGCNPWPSLMLAGCFVNPQRRGCAGDINFRRGLHQPN